MEENNNMNDLIKRAQEMIKNNQIPDEVKQIMGNMASNSNMNNGTVSSNSPNNNVSNNLASKSNNTGTANVDMSQLMGMLSKLNNSASDDDMSRLLFALKPYLRNERKEKVDEYVKLIRMGKMAQLFDALNNKTNK